MFASASLLEALVQTKQIAFGGMICSVKILKVLIPVFDFFVMEDLMALLMLAGK